MPISPKATPLLIPPPKKQQLGPAGELLLLARRHRWAFEELTMDAKTTEWNKLHNAGPQVMYNYLKNHYQSGFLLLQALRKLLQTGKVPITIEATTPREELQTIITRYKWTLEELTLEVKEKEAEAMYGSVNEMYRYLMTTYGTGMEVLRQLQSVCGYGRRFKTTDRTEP
jgi:hypothetical protein